MSVDFGISVEKNTLNGQSIPNGTIQIAPSGTTIPTVLSVGALETIEAAYQYSQDDDKRQFPNTSSSGQCSPVP